ncbi:MAG: 50S ribosomal protein L11 methyltransferase, partial [Thermoleophilia bacterium]|nr:50S ribosomal protein L11 methyltransferase [Thermoleophilia bacterium]MDH3725254.1 50S ribosomal protein L11 methyltransferase [Thermoleophilia bacterium]
MSAPTEATRVFSADSNKPSAELARLTAIVPAERTADALVVAAQLHSAGCQERQLGDGRVALDFWFSAPGAERALSDALAAAPVRAEVHVSMDTTDWQASMREFHRPIAVEPLYLRPPWEPARDGAIDVVIDPGMAFGTGQHPTTRSCLELLVRRPPGSLLDAGCGSGVLAIAACKLGHDPVIAVDEDPDCILSASANAAANRVPLKARFARIGKDPLPAARGVVANLTATVMPLLSGALVDAPPEWLIISGLRGFEAAEASEAFAPLGLEVGARREADPWVTLLLER